MIRSQSLKRGREEAGCTTFCQLHRNPAGRARERPDPWHLFSRQTYAAGQKQQAPSAPPQCPWLATLEYSVARCSKKYAEEIGVLDDPALVDLEGGAEDSLLIVAGNVEMLGRASCSMIDCQISGQSMPLAMNNFSRCGLRTDIELDRILLV